VASWNGSTRPTVYNQNTGQLAVTLNASDISAPGVAYVTVTNPPPGGGTTLNGASFQITQPPNPAPQIMSLSPASTPEGTLPPPNGILTINGPPTAAGSISPAFVATSIAAFNGSVRATTFVSATELQVQMLASDVATATTITVTVNTPAPGGGVANAQFTVTDPPNAANFPQVISVSATGGAANGASSSPAMSADGRYVAFYSEAKNLVASGASGNIFVRDTCVGATNCTPHTIAVDLGPDGSVPNAASDGGVAISGDGRFVAFVSQATNLVHMHESGDAPPRSNVFVHDLCTGFGVAAGCVPHTELVSMGIGGRPADDDSFSPSLSVDGRFISFDSDATDLVSGITTSETRVYVSDLCVGKTAGKGCVRQTLLASVDLDGEVGELAGRAASISADGRYVAFHGWSLDPVQNGSELKAQVFLRDTCLGADAPRECVASTTVVSVSGDGSMGNSSSWSPSVSGDGRFVVFESLASNLAAEATGGNWEVLLRDTCLGISAPRDCERSTTVVSLEPVVSGGNFESMAPSITPSGRYIAFEASIAVLGPTSHAYVRDTCAGLDGSQCTPGTIRVSVSSHGEIGDGSTVSPIAVSADGRIFGFHSRATNLASPASGLGDVFLTTTPSQP
jgi:Tol biopolymer transport system component